MKSAIAMLVLTATAMTLSVASASMVVKQKDRAFSLKELKIRAGDEVVFVNEDAVTHNIYSLSKGNEFEVKTQPPGQSDKIRFSRTGTAEVLCAIHPKMKLLVHIEP
jgi:plastocyanin